MHSSTTYSLQGPLSRIRILKRARNFVCRTALCAFEIINAARVQNIASTLSCHDLTVGPMQSNPRGEVEFCAHTVNIGHSAVKSILVFSSQ